MPRIKPTKQAVDQHFSFLDRFFNGQTDAQDPQDIQRLARIKQLQEQQSVIFSDEFLDIPVANAAQALQTTRPGQPNGGQPVNIPLNKAAPDPNDPATVAVRTFSKFRLVHGPVDFRFDENNPQRTKPFDVISTCAPNLMSSSTADERQFAHDNGKFEQRPGRNGAMQAVRVLDLNEAEYRKACEAQADFIVKAAKDKGNDALIMPGFGVGVYIKRLSTEGQAKAREIMAEAFAKASAKHAMPIQWVAYDAKAHKQMSAAVVKAQTLHPDTKLALVQGDMFDYLENSAQNGFKKPALLNPGSDRTIGGNFTARDPHTGEEQIAQCTDLLAIQTTANPHLVSSFTQDFEQRKALQQQKQQGIQPSQQAVNPSPAIQSQQPKLSPIQNNSALTPAPRTPLTLNEQIASDVNKIFAVHDFKTKIVAHKNQRVPREKISAAQITDCKKLANLSVKLIHSEQKPAGAFILKNGEGVQITFRTKEDAEKFATKIRASGLENTNQIHACPKGTDKTERWGVNISQQTMAKLMEIDNDPDKNAKFGLKS